MKLLLASQKKQLAKNGLNFDADHKPVVKFFNPCGAATWIITQSDPDDDDLLYGLCDLGMGHPEIGSVRLSELASVRVLQGLGIERDMHFVANKTLSEYATEARERGYLSA